jgi:hypothetical protein
MEQLRDARKVQKLADPFMKYWTYPKYETSITHRSKANSIDSLSDDYFDEITDENKS